MNLADRGQRIVALKAIAQKAEDLANKGLDAVGVRTFIAGARRKLAEEKPDPETYYKAVMAAKARRGMSQKRRGRDMENEQEFENEMEDEQKYGRERMPRADRRIERERRFED